MNNQYPLIKSFVKSTLIFGFISFNHVLNAQQSSTLDNVLLNSPETEQNYYCEFLSTKAKAKQINLYSPDLVSKVDQTDSNDKRFTIALTKDLIDLKRAQNIKKLAENECLLYKFNQNANIYAQYLLANIEAQTLIFKLEGIEEAKKNLNVMIKTVNQRVITQNETLPNLYAIEEKFYKLTETSKQIKSQLAQMKFPHIETDDFNALLKNIWLKENEHQLILNELEKDTSWSFQVVIGVQKTLNKEPTNKFANFVGFNAKYNLGKFFSDRELDNSQGSYLKWKNASLNGSQQNISRLIVTLVELRRTEKNRLEMLIDISREKSKITHKLDNIPESVDAQRFKNQINLDDIFNRLEIKSTTKKIELIDQYLSEAGIK